MMFRKNQTPEIDHLKNSKDILNKIVELKLYDINNQDQVRIMQNNAEAYGAKAEVYQKFVSSVKNALTERLAALEAEHIKLNQELDKIHFDEFDEPLRIYLNPKNTSTSNTNKPTSQPIYSTVTKDHTVTIENIEEKALEMLQGIQTWAKNNKKDAFTTAVQNFTEKEIMFVSGNLFGAINYISRVHPFYASVLNFSEGVNLHVESLLKLLKEKNAKELATTSFNDFSTRLKQINDWMIRLDNISKQMPAIEETYKDVQNFRKLMTGFKFSLGSEKDISSNPKYKEAADLITNLHMIICTQIEIAELMYHDIDTHARKNIANDITNHVKALDVPKQKMQAIIKAKESALARKKLEFLNGKQIPEPRQLEPQKTNGPSL